MVAEGTVGLLGRLRKLNLAFNFVTVEMARALAGAWHAAMGEEDGGVGVVVDDEKEEEEEEKKKGCALAGRECGCRRRPERRLDLYQNEIRARERAELLEEMREHFPGLECTL